MTIREELNKNPEEFKKIGFIFYCLIRIEINLNLLIDSCFCVFRVGQHPIEVNQTTGMIFNRALHDKNIFPTLENKRRFLLKMIDILEKDAKRSGLSFEAERWRNFCRSILKVQETRNNLAHKFFSFPGNNAASYIVPKRDQSFESKNIKLDDEIGEVERVYEESETAITEFLSQALNVFRYS